MTLHFGRHNWPVTSAKWRLRNERRNSILMTCHYTDLDGASDWSCCEENLLQPIWTLGGTYDSLFCTVLNGCLFDLKPLKEVKVGDRDVYMVPALFLLKKSYNVSLKTNLILQAKQNQSGHKVTSLFLGKSRGNRFWFELARVSS